MRQAGKDKRDLALLLRNRSPAAEAVEARHHGIQNVLDERRKAGKLAESRERSRQRVHRLSK